MADRKKLRPVLNKSRCKGCGLCIAFCPKKVFDTDFEGKCIVARPEDCIGCMACDFRCPDFALEVREER